MPFDSRGKIDANKNQSGTGDLYGRERLIEQEVSQQRRADRFGQQGDGDHRSAEEAQRPVVSGVAEYLADQRQADKVQPDRR